MLSNIRFTNEDDTITQAFEKFGNFSTTSLYRELAFPSVPNIITTEIWKVKIPLKELMYSYDRFVMTHETIYRITC